VVVHGEALRLRLRRPGVALRPGGAADAAGEVEVAALRRSVVAGDAAVSPAQIVDGGEVREEAEPLAVTEVQTGLGQARGIDDERRLPVLVPPLDEPWDTLEGQDATPRIS
jgi:hypothetical protein